MSRGDIEQGNCKWITELLSAYLDDEVTAGEQVQVEEHLKSCEACRAELESLRATTALLSSLPLERVPRSFLIEAPEPQPSRWFRYFGALRLATAAVVLVLAMVSGLDLARHQSLLGGALTGAYQPQAPAAVERAVEATPSPPSDQATIAADRQADSEPEVASEAPEIAPALGAAPAEDAETAASSKAPEAGLQAEAEETAAPEATAPAGEESDASGEFLQPEPAQTSTPAAEAGNEQIAEPAPEAADSGGEEPAAAAAPSEAGPGGNGLWFRVAEVTLALLAIAMLAVLLIAKRSEGTTERR